MRHPDEGEIHAWLDGTLDPATAAGLEAHVAACPACAASVAEARGLIAGASRILLGLDGVPSGVLPARAGQAGIFPDDELSDGNFEQQAATTRAAWRHAPWYARRPVQIAAGLMLVAGVGGVVVRSTDRSADQVSVQVEADIAAASRGPAVSSGAAPVRQSGVVAEAQSGDVAITVPPPPAPESPGPGQATSQSPRRADQSKAAGDAGAPGSRSVERRQEAQALADRAISPPSATGQMAPNPVANLSARSVADSTAVRPAVEGGRIAEPSIALTQNALQLRGVTVTGGAADFSGVNGLGGVGGACFALGVDPDGDVAGTPLLPLRVRIRMADAPVVSALGRQETKSARIEATLPAAAAARGYAGTPSEPARPLPWQPVSTDSIDVTWATESDVITLRLQIRGDAVQGTATSSQGSPARTAKVSGRKVTCERGP